MSSIVYRILYLLIGFGSYARPQGRAQHAEDAKRSAINSGKDADQQFWDELHDDIDASAAIASEESSDEESEEDAMDEDAPKKLYTLLDKGATPTSASRPLPSEQEQDEYNKDLPYLDRDDEEFLEDVRTTRWSHHVGDIMERPRYMAKVLERTGRLNPTTRNIVLKELLKVLSRDVINFVANEQLRWANCLQEEKEHPDRIASEYAHDEQIFSDSIHLRHVVFHEHWGKYLMPALSKMSEQGREEEAFEAVEKTNRFDKSLVSRLRQRWQEWKGKMAKGATKRDPAPQPAAREEQPPHWKSTPPDSRIFEDLPRLTEYLLDKENWKRV